MTRRASVQEVKSHAIDRLEEILDRLAPGGRSAGGKYVPLNPTRHDRRPGSFVISLIGPARGAFVEYTNPSQEKGDIIDLVSYLLCGAGPDFKSDARRVDAIRWISDFVGLERMPDTARSAAAEAAKRRQAEASRAGEELERKRQRAFDMWRTARPAESSAVETYLRRRGIALRDVAHLEGDLRCIPSLEYWLERERKPGAARPKPGRSFPAMIAAMRDTQGAVRSVHCTFLLPDGSGKADVVRPKLIWPEFRGCVIRLSRGASGLSVPDAIAAGILETVALSEGIEDGLSIALGAPELRVWAAAAVSNMGNAPALPIVDAWLIHRQNDTSRAAIEEFERVRRQLEATARPVGVIESHFGKDINDLLRAGAPRIGAAEDLPTVTTKENHDH